MSLMNPSIVILEYAHTIKKGKKSIDRINLVIQLRSPCIVRAEMFLLSLFDTALSSTDLFLRFDFTKRFK